MTEVKLILYYSQRSRRPRAGIFVYSPSIMIWCILFNVYLKIFILLYKQQDLLMNLINYLYLLLIEPIRLVFEFIYFYAYKFTGNCGFSILVLSLVVNILALPLYIRADELQNQAREKDASVRSVADRIKKSFSGDEKVMMLQAYYREANYSPLNTVKGLTSLMLQIPFFMAAYYFLSELKMLHGVSLGPIHDLGLPDALIPIGNIRINALPILMTAVNLISSFNYAGKEPLKEKLKLILIAMVFLFLLYDSPSGLVFYWTLNNVFSLVKNIVGCTISKKHTKPASARSKSKTDGRLIALSCGVLTVLTGIMIPADVISENPTELINTFSSTPHNPTLYLVSSMLIAIGMFLIWIPLFIYLTKERFGKIMEYLMPICALTAVLNYIAFNENFGLLSRKLIYDYPMEFSQNKILINLGADILFAVFAFGLVFKLRKITKTLTAVLLLTCLFLSISNVVMIVSVSSLSTYDFNTDTEDINIPLTTSGQNVILIMMDRMIGAYIPYIFNERPDVAAQFDGFIYYPNTVSFGGHTNTAAPALYGGYEYTPANINLRADEPLVDKHNESLRVLPTIFADNGWNVSVGDPAYANYSWIPDVSIYDDNENINAFRLSGMFNEQIELLTDAGEEIETRLNRNLFCFGLMKTMPYILQPIVYSDGSYNYINHYYNGYVDNTYVATTPHYQIGLFETNAQEYAAINALCDITTTCDDSQNCFCMITNSLTHEVCLMNEPDYTPGSMIDNTEYDAEHEDRFVVDGVTMHMDTNFLDYSQYECNMSACICLGRWFDYLRANNLYDNSRIIIVADHGFGLEQFDDLLVSNPEFDAEWVNPVLLVKDFGSQGFSVSYDFMTNADTPFICLNGVIDNPVNPFTGNPIVEYDKTGEQLVYMSDEWNVDFNHGTQFVDPNGYWLTVSGNIWDDDNWNEYSYN